MGKRARLKAYRLRRDSQYVKKGLEKPEMSKILQLAQDLLEAQEAERKKIAAELHDGVGQALAAMKFTMESGLAQIAQGNIGEPPGGDCHDPERRRGDPPDPERAAAFPAE
jgi:signal transduction histidine kinase